MDKSILNRLARLERTGPGSGVAILTLKPDGLWELFHADRSHVRNVYRTEEEAKSHVRPGECLIIDDL